MNADPLIHNAQLMTVPRVGNICVTDETYKFAALMSMVMGLQIGSAQKPPVLHAHRKIINNLEIIVCFSNRLGLNPLHPCFCLRQAL